MFIIKSISFQFKIVKVNSTNFPKPTTFFPFFNGLENERKTNDIFDFDFKVDFGELDFIMLAYLSLVLFISWVFHVFKLSQNKGEFYSFIFFVIKVH